MISLARTNISTNSGLVTETVPAVDVLVTRHAAIGNVIEAMALVEPDTSEEKIVGPADDG
jgi:hypothetical protein